uniref:Alpha/beta hydrolase fold-3 domain-containing protein n=1 Tax=Cucumis sativus TaxID=3659 RepID=A0A0A0KVP9_CUCSA
MPNHCKKLKRMTTISIDPRLKLQIPKLCIQNEATTEEIEGVIRVYADGRVERPPIIPNLPLNETSPYLFISMAMASVLALPHGAVTMNSSSTLLPKQNGIILIEPFFGGESRTKSEKLTAQPSFGSALTLNVVDTYWRLSLPKGANRDHKWSNPLVNGVAKLRETKVPLLMVCISELDILVDRNLEFCAAMAATKKKMERVILKGVGHSFQILKKEQISNVRRQEMMGCIQAFIQIQQ